MFIAHCYFIALEFIKDARKSLLKEYRLDALHPERGLTQRALHEYENVR